MGNVQTASIANQLLPFETYISDVPELKVSHSLGSTRFMKVARAEHAEGPVVVKVFVPVDQYFSVEPYREQVYQLRRKLSKHPNCCPFTRLTSRAILCRPFEKYTLYLRLSTRPFLLDIEKQWIAFQLLKALSQCRIAMICHGDIKSENVLVSSSLWVRLTDFASFKPAFLPYDNPSMFTFFFDTSRRRSCNLAPERFKKSDGITYSPRFPGEFLNLSEGLTEAMDIFAMGCVLVELLTDGRQVAFTLPQAIDYKRMEEHAAHAYLQRILSNLPAEFCPLISIMLDRDPVKRKEMFANFSPCSSSLFPSFFEDYLYRYLKEFRSPMAPDDVITKLYIERDSYMPHLNVQERNNECVLLFVNVVTSNLRACRSLSAKMDAIALFQLFSEMQPSIIGDRILPYMAHLVTDHFPQIRAEAMFVLTEMLSKFSDVLMAEECRLLTDFILPKLKVVTVDSSNLVKSALATNLGRLAVISMKFMEESGQRRRDEAMELANNNNAENWEDSERQMVKAEREALHEMVNELFVNLCGSDNVVRQCLFEPENLALLCQFFGHDRATDILMHMITLLNDKPDWRIRATFFECCPTVARHLGQTRCAQLMPFLQQGLQDWEEYVIYETLCCVHALCDEKLLSKALICELMRDIAPFLVHPNKWLRVCVVNILTVVDTTFNVSEFYCKISPLVAPFLRESLIRMNDRAVVYHCLVEPIPRAIWEFVVGYQFSAELLATLENRRTLDKLGGGRNSLFSAAANATIDATTVNSPVSLGDTSTSHNDSSSTFNDTSLSMLNTISGGGGGGTTADNMGTSPNVVGGTTAGGNGLLMDKEASLESAVRKLANLGLNEEVEDKLLTFKSVLSKINCFDPSAFLFTSTSIFPSANSPLTNSALSTTTGQPPGGQNDHNTSNFINTSTHLSRSNKKRHPLDDHALHDLNGDNENAVIHLEDVPKVRRHLYDLETGMWRVVGINGTFVVRNGDAVGSGRPPLHSDSGGSVTSGGSVSSASELLMSPAGGAALRMTLPPMASSAFVQDLEVSAAVCDLNNYRCSSARFQLEETLNHKRRRYQEQKRINSASESGDVARQLAAAVDEVMAVSPPSLALHRVGGPSFSPSADLDALAEKSSGKRRMGVITDYTGSSSSSSGAQRVELRLLSHLHEHSDHVTRMTLHPDKNHFASCSADRTIKLWSASALFDNSHPAALSRDTYRYSCRINTCAFMGGGGGGANSSQLAIAPADGQLQVFDVEHRRLVKTFQLDTDADGPITNLQCFGHLIYALTHHSGVYCFDLRVMPKTSRHMVTLEPVWSRRVKNSYGLMTSISVDCANQHWMVLTASSATTKNLLLWDLRFGGLEVAGWSHPSDRVIPLRSWPLARGSHCSEVFTNASREGEISLWDLSTQSRTDVLWPSTEQPLVYKRERVTGALTASCIDSDLIFTGDSDGALRCWNMRCADASSYLCGPYRKCVSYAAGSGSVVPSAESMVSTAVGGRSLKTSGNISASGRIRYNSIKFRDNLLRIQAENRSALEAPPPNGGVDAVDSPQKLLQVSDYHHDAITDLLSIWPDLMVSSSRDGVIKMWRAN